MDDSTNKSIFHNVYFQPTSYIWYEKKNACDFSIYYFIKKMSILGHKSKLYL